MLLSLFSHHFLPKIYTSVPNYSSALFQKKTVNMCTFCTYFATGVIINHSIISKFSS